MKVLTILIALCWLTPPDSSPSSPPTESPGLPSGPPPAGELPRVTLAELDTKSGRGYRLLVPHDLAKRLHVLLVEKLDEELLASLLQARSDDLKTRLLILMVKRNVAQFKQDLAKHNGPFGVEIIVVGPKWWELIPRHRSDAGQAAGLDHWRRRLEGVRHLLPRKARQVYDAATTAPVRVTVRPYLPAL